MAENRQPSYIPETGLRPEMREKLNGGSEPLVYAFTSEPVQGVVFDMDGTLYDNPEYHQHAQQVDTEVMGHLLGMDPAEARQVVKSERVTYGKELGLDCPARLTQTLVDRFGVSKEDWDRLRAEGYQPEQFIKPDSALVNRLKTMATDVQIAVASNSPTGAVHRLLQCLGIDTSSINIYGPDTLGVCKPDPRYFQQVAQDLGIAPEALMSVGNEFDNDADPAIAAGYGATIVRGPQEIAKVHNIITSKEYLTPFDLAQLPSQLYVPGQDRVIGFGGRAGGGKTTNAHRFAEHCIEQGIPADVVSLDAFFKMSSPDRAAWLNDPNISKAERAWREDQMQWWDFRQAAEVIQALREGKGVHLEGVYNQADKGLKTGTLHIEPSGSEGRLIIFEGVGIPVVSDVIDQMVYINSHQTVREVRVLQRDIAKRGPEEAHRRWRMTQGFENRLYGQAYQPNPGEAIVLDNSNPDQLRQLPSRIPAR